MRLALVIALFASLDIADSYTGHGSNKRPLNSDPVIRTEVKHDATIKRQSSPEEYANEKTCTPLQNHGAFFTVDAHVGTPAQKIAIVADTGSDSLIVETCKCKSHGACPGMECFTGNTKSSTFTFTQEEDSFPIVTMRFGSGTIKSSIGTDVVRVGQASAKMKDGVLLMYEQHLDFNRSDFSGILGLGCPKTSYHSYQAVSFLKSAGISRFSICANQGQPGVLRMGIPAFTKAVTSVGENHWAFSFHGISIGSKSALVKFCDQKSEHQDTPCGAIPDSGTTMIMGPKKQVDQLEEALCDEWPRCLEARKSAHKSEKKSTTLQRLLAHCASWGSDMSELPPLHFHIAGSDGQKQTVSLDAKSYVFSASSMSDMLSVAKQLKDNDFVETFQELALVEESPEQACGLSFDYMNYMTERNGDIWILGTPFFFEYQVAYDLDAQPSGAMEFVDAPCGSCAEDSLVSLNDSVPTIGASGDALPSSQTHHPRRIYGQLRRPSVDVTLPL